MDVVESSVGRSREEGSLACSSSVAGGAGGQVWYGMVRYGMVREVEMWLCRSSSWDMSCVMSLWCGPRPAHYWAVWSRVASALSGVASQQPPCHYYTSLPHGSLTSSPC